MSQFDRKLRGILLKAGLIDEEAAESLIGRSKSERRSLTEIIIKDGIATEAKTEFANMHAYAVADHVNEMRIREGDGLITFSSIQRARTMSGRSISAYWSGIDRQPSL